MEFIKQRKVRKVGWRLSEETRILVAQYAEFTQVPAEMVVDAFLLNIRKDNEFTAWLDKKTQKAAQAK